MCKICSYCLKVWDILNITFHGACHEKALLLLVKEVECSPNSSSSHAKCFVNIFFSLNYGKHFSVKIIFTCTLIITFNNNNICILTYNNNSSCKTCKHSRLTNRFTCTSRHKLEYNLSTGLTRTWPLNAQHSITGHHLAVLKIFYMYKSILEQCQ